MTRPSTHLWLTLAETKQLLFKIAALALRLRQEAAQHVPHLGEHKLRLLREKLDNLLDDLEDLFP